MFEPRHASWFDDDVDSLLTEYGAARVAADPAVVPRAAQSGGCPDIVYHRLHGSPKIYYSNYGPAYLRALAKRLREASKTARELWCVFDNTALGYATGNALTVQRIVRRA